jgi:hypothetical protein
MWEYRLVSITDRCLRFAHMSARFFLFVFPSATRCALLVWPALLLLGIGPTPQDLPKSIISSSSSALPFQRHFSRFFEGSQAELYM